MRTARTRPDSPAGTRTWDLMPLVVVGLAAGFVVPLLAATGSAGGAVVGFFALVLVSTGAVRRLRRTSWEADSRTREPVPGRV